MLVLLGSFSTTRRVGLGRPRAETRPAALKPWGKQTGTGCTARKPLPFRRVTVDDKGVSYEREGDMEQMLSEIRGQASLVARMAADPAPYVEAARAARESGKRFVLFAARGTSHNAAMYGKYLAAVYAGLPAGLAIPSASTLYGADMDLSGCVVVGVSQSGHTPDVTDYVKDARRRGAFTVAVTHDETTPLAAAADALVLTHEPPVGGERSASKTYVSHLTALALFWAAWSDDEDLLEALRDEVPRAMQRALDLEGKTARIAPRYRSREHLVVVGRGFNYATALETALTLRETCHLFAAAYAGADLMHGPIAGIEPGLPAIVYALPGKAYGYTVDLVRELQARGLDLLVIGPTGPATERATLSLELPASVPEPASPLVAILPAQLLAYHLCRYMGLDPDSPRRARDRTPLT
jgi:glucosamine--fructose-6-phosphate aminotransferase (isomerizing)